jgi:hypothetical protein
LVNISKFGENYLVLQSSERSKNKGEVTEVDYQDWLLTLDFAG